MRIFLRIFIPLEAQSSSSCRRSAPGLSLTMTWSATISFERMISSASFPSSPSAFRARTTSSTRTSGYFMSVFRSRTRVNSPFPRTGVVRSSTTSAPVKRRDSRAAGGSPAL